MIIYRSVPKLLEDVHMPYEKVKQAEKISIGTKQATRIVELGKALEVFVAKDADPRITSKMVNLCKKMGVQVTYVDSMKMLGKACGIEVGAAMAAVMNE
jgi:large subunit ribosomal protein L7A